MFVIVDFKKMKYWFQGNDFLNSTQQSMKFAKLYKYQDIFTCFETDDSVCLFDLILNVPVNFCKCLGWTSTKQRIKYQHSASPETQNRNPSVTSQAFYHWATELLNWR